MPALSFFSLFLYWPEKDLTKIMIDEIWPLLQNGTFGVGYEYIRYDICFSVLEAGIVGWLDIWRKVIWAAIIEGTRYLIFAPGSGGGKTTRRYINFYENRVGNGKPCHIF